MIMPDKPVVLVIYSSYSGHTEDLAHAIAEGAGEAQNVSADVKKVTDLKREDIENASAYAFGSPTYFSYMSGELKHFFDLTYPHRNMFEGKPAIAFATGEGGQIKCIESIEGILDLFGLRLISRTDILYAGLAVQGAPDDNAKKTARSAGKKLAEAGVDYLCDLKARESGLTIGRR